MKSLRYLAALVPLALLGLGAVWLWQQVDVEELPDPAGQPQVADAPAEGSNKEVPTETADPGGDPPMEVRKALPVVEEHEAGVAAVEPEPERVSELLSLAGRTVVYFPKSSAYLRASERAKLKPLAAALKAAPGEILVIAGMTDPFGNPEFNAWLREARSGAVLEKLQSYGAPSSQLSLGEPAGDDEDSRKLPRDELRRVEFAVEGREAIAVAKSDQPKPSTPPNTPAPDGNSDAAISGGDTLLFRSASGIDRLAMLSQAAAATRVYFGYSDAQVKGEYRRDLRALANLILSTSDGAVRVTGCASPAFDDALRRKLATRRCRAVVALLHDMGVSWERIDFDPEPGTAAAGGPNWRNHRVEFTAVRFVPEEDLAEASEPVETDDDLAALLAESVFYFGNSSASIRRSDRAKLARVARRLTADAESRVIGVRAFADRWGNEDFNMALARQRQGAIFDALVELGVPLERLEAAEIAIASEGGPSWKQRRAELVIY